MIFTKNTFGDRLMAIALFIFFSFMFINALYFETLPFPTDPLGPKVFPLIIAAIGAICSMILFIFPKANKAAPTKDLYQRLIYVGIILLFYSFSFERIGFIISTFIMAVLISWLFNIHLRTRIIFGIVLAFCSYVILSFLLELNIPNWYLEDAINSAIKMLSKGA